jgi:serine protease Do
MQSQNPYQRQSTESETVESGTGSGVIYKKADGKAYIITNNHVIEGAKEVEISLYDGQKATAAVVGADALTDLAVLTIDSSKAPEGIKFGNSDSMRPGKKYWQLATHLDLIFHDRLHKESSVRPDAPFQSIPRTGSGHLMSFKQMQRSTLVIAAVH